MGSAPKAPERHTERNRKGSFWKTLPGVVTALATLITALTGLMVALCQNHILICPPPLPPIIKADRVGTLVAKAGGDTYEISSGQVHAYSATKSELALDVVMHCGAKGKNFWDNLFRLDVDGVSLAPEPGLSNKWCLNEDWQETVKFIFPSDAKTVKLVVGEAGSAETAPIELSGGQLAKWTTAR
jgi:hypothetical protein